MQDFAWVLDEDATVQSVQHGHESSSRAFNSANENDDHVAVGVEMHGMVDSVVDFAASNQLLAAADDYFDWQEFDELVEDVKGREERWEGEWQRWQFCER